MKITQVDVFITCPGRTNYVIVKILTDEPGLFGLGNGTLMGGELALATLIEQHLAPRLIGIDPDRVEDTWQLLQRATYWRSGRAVVAALAAIDMALWDLKGKRYGAPLYSLLGGKCREGVLCYGHASGRTIDETLEQVIRYRELGCKAIRAQVATPGYEDGSYGVRATGVAADPAHDTRTWEPTPYLRIVPRLFERLRSEVGDDVELLHDAHDRLTPIQAAQLAKELEPYHLFFLEDPIPVENKDGLRLIRQHSTTPIAIGERFNSKWDCLPLLADQLIDYVRNPMSKSGGITELRKIATLAEPYQIKTAFQGPADVSPIAFAATVHLDLAIPNFGIQEWAEFSDDVTDLFQGIPTFRDGYLQVSDAPGLGIEIDEEHLRRYPYRPHYFPTIRRLDGSLQDP